MATVVAMRSNQFAELESWAFWTLGHDQWVDFLGQVTDSLNALPPTEVSMDRCIRGPAYTSNLGHLALLALRAAELREAGSSQQLCVPTRKLPNSTYFDLITERFRNVRAEVSNPHTFSLTQGLKNESLLFARDSEGFWKVQPAASQAMGKDLPGLNSLLANPLEAPALDEQARGRLEDLGLFEADWFMILHVRQSTDSPTQARDSDIYKARPLVDRIRQLGGLCVRMGNPSFPRFNVEGCLDYAHSRHRSELLDVWLWANARWWTGNPSGAASAMLTFRTPRVLFDVWPWDGIGRSRDLWCPTLLRDGRKGKVLDPKEVMRSNLSRAMNPKHFANGGYELIRCNEDEILEANAQMWLKTSEPLSDRAENTMKLDLIQESMGLALSNLGTNTFMPMANVAAQKYLTLLGS